MIGKAGKETPILAGAGFTLAAISTVLYYLAERFMVSTPENAGYYTQTALLYLVVLFLGGVIVLLDLRGVVGARIRAIRDSGRAPLSPSWLIPYVLSQKKYARIMAVATVVYGLFYAVITSMLVYEPAVNIAQAYGVAVPSAAVAACCGSPLFIPMVTVYLAAHLALLVIPLTAVLLAAVSALVGLNVAIAAFAYDSQVKGVNRGWLGGLGALVGLFTGCPTCAGLFFANFLGGSGAATFATVLGYYQPVFIVLSLPVLVVAPYLVSRTLSRVFKEGCVLMPKAQSG